jgi:hypothetical protein
MEVVIEPLSHPSSKWDDVATSVRQQATSRSSSRDHCPFEAHLRPTFEKGNDFFPRSDATQVPTQAIECPSTHARSHAWVVLPDGDKGPLVEIPLVLASGCGSHGSPHHPFHNSNGAMAMTEVIAPISLAHYPVTVQSREETQPWQQSRPI